MPKTLQRHISDEGSENFCRRRDNRRFNLAALVGGGDSFWNISIVSGGGSQPEIESSLVLFKDRQIIKVFPLQTIETGWSGIQTAWPFVLFGFLPGVMFGFPMGELARSVLAIDQASKKALRKSEALTLDEFIKKSRAESVVRQTNKLFVESQQLKEEVARLRKKVFDMNMSAKKQNQSMEKLRRKAESAKKELVKAKAKIRRLTEKERPQSRPNGKSAFYPVRCGGAGG